MAPSAGGGNIAVIYRRLGVVGSQNLVRASVAVPAIGRRCSTGLGRLGVQAVLVRHLLVGVAIGAGRIPPGVLVGRIVSRLVAIHAGEQGTVDRMLQLVFIHVQADLLAVHVFGHGGVGVAGKTVFVRRLMLGIGRTGPDKQG